MRHTAVLPDGAQVEYCLTRIVPIWERWTEGNSAPRLLLESACLGPQQQEERLLSLVAALTVLRLHNRNPDSEAALLAAQACMEAIEGGTAEAFDAHCQRAIEADSVACRELSD